MKFLRRSWAPILLARRPACVDDPLRQARRLRTEAAFNAVQAEFVDDQQLGAGVEADAVVDRLIGQGGAAPYRSILPGTLRKSPSRKAMIRSRMTRRPGNPTRAKNSRRPWKNRSVFDERLVVGLVYWVSMFNTDRNFVPMGIYVLQLEDLCYLRNKKDGLQNTTFEEFNRVRKKLEDEKLEDRPEKAPNNAQTLFKKT